ncbi:hypothetical protein X777_11655 [Ooceraea biroi]|uniref:Uncharacterized protein n=1 Tax=Ooceraea biroi TaxID=2015173 RepID=A0A026W193_OOCBI|nr:hypothetical protein X777_11655 [Ooceraea biroi]
MNRRDETCDERIRCGRHGRRDAGAPPSQDPGVVRFWPDGGDDDDGGGDDDDGDDDNDGDTDDCECDNGERQRMLRRRANHDDNVPLAGAEGLAKDGQSRSER